MRTPRFLLLLGAASALWLAGCQQVPVTGRSSLNLVDDKDIREKSAQAFAEMKKKYPVSKNRAQIAQVERVGQRLARVAFWDVPNADWEFVVFEMPKSINAFAMPGGKVGVFSGLFKIIKNDDQLASVLAHEIAHVSAKHSHERMSQSMLAQVGGLALGGAMIGSGAVYDPGAIMQLYGMGTLATMTAYSRNAEKEADHIGIIYMARAGYNPEEAVKVMEQLEQASAGKAQPSPWFSTHPTHPERILQLMDLLPKAQSEFAKSKPQTAGAPPYKQ
jgi:predicted Zn-dependent protease